MKTPKTLRAWGKVPALVSQRMAKVRRRDTGPEQRLTRFLMANGLKFERHATQLPGSPDIVFKRHKVAVFVHGCFWHGHAGCRRAQLPSANALVWERKIEANIRRDHRVVRALRAMGWSVLIVWACNMRTAGLSRFRSRLLSRLSRSCVNPRCKNSRAPAEGRLRCRGMSLLRHDGSGCARHRSKKTKDLGAGHCMTNTRRAATKK
jgi:DNA mismatch endonuclease (patch repair protein)